MQSSRAVFSLFFLHRDLILGLDIVFSHSFQAKCTCIMLSRLVIALTAITAASALTIPGLAALNPNILTAGNSLINANVLANVLSKDLHRVADSLARR